MVSWLYGLLFGLGIASGILAFGALMAGCITSAESYKIVSIICFSLLPVLIITSAVLISVCLSLGKI